MKSLTPGEVFSLRAPARAASGLDNPRAQRKPGSKGAAWHRPGWQGATGRVSIGNGINSGPAASAARSLAAGLPARQLGVPGRPPLSPPPPPPPPHALVRQEGGAARPRCLEEKFARSFSQQGERGAPGDRRRAGGRRDRSRGMDALKSAGRAIIRSPSVAKQSWGSGRHQKLPENWTDTRETLLEGMQFSLKYLGMTLVEQPKGEELSAAAVKRIVATAKASGRKLRKVTLKVSPRGIILSDSITGEPIENISIYRISYCTADKAHDKVFAYIAQSQYNENLECHAFLCTKRKMAQAVTLTVAQAFKVAFEFWQVSKEEKEKREKALLEGESTSSPTSDNSESSKGSVTTENLLDLENVAKTPLTINTNSIHLDGSIFRPHSSENNNVVWPLDDELDEAFSRLAQSRTNPQVLDIGLTAQDIQSDTNLSPVDWNKVDSTTAAEKDDHLFEF
uniref:Low density lipoprotein receptor adaptor protein 1 n=1 Tax=Salvator merianae TaxID=96440 RepID=A0A8D0B6L3_SALMN